MPPWLPLLAALLLPLARTAPGQELDPRRWSRLPADMNFMGVGYAYTEADINFDPVLQLEEVTLDLKSVVAKYVRTFSLLDRPARIEATLPYQDARWEGLLRGEPASTSREGFADPQARFAVNLVGGPSLKGKEFAAYMAAHPVETTVGAGVTLTMPFGEYQEDKLLNLGENRYTIRPELGVEHRRNKWLSEITVSSSFFTENDDFWNGNRREQDPMYIAQGFLSYTFRPGLWVGSGIGYGFGGESSINGVDKHDDRENMATGLVAGVPLNRSVGFKFAYINTQTLSDTGVDSDTLAVAVSALW